MAAPVCHIPPTTPVSQPAPKFLPAIPPATDLASALAAINQIRNVIHILAGQQGNAGPRGASGKDGTNANANVQWVEESRVEETIRIKNPDDPTQFVDVKRINQLKMKDQKSGQAWVFNRGSD